MKRNFYKRLTAVLLLLVSLSVFCAGCDFSLGDLTGSVTGNPIALSRPQNVRVEGNVVKWSSVPNASSYLVQIGSASNQDVVSGLECPISSILDESATGLYVKVKARSGNVLYSDSDWSATYGPFDYEKPTGGNHGFSEYESNGLGRTINVITATSFETWSGGVNIFDTNALFEMDTQSYSIGKQEAEHSQGYTFEEMANGWSLEMAKKTARSAGVGMPIDGITLGLSSSFSSTISGGYEVKRASETETFYYKHRQVITGKRVEIDDYRDASRFQAILSGGFLADAQAVCDGTMTPEQFVYKYGTHVIMAGYFGAAIDVDYSVVRHAEDEAEDWRAGLQVSLGMGLSAGMGDTSISAGVGEGFDVDFSKFVSSATTNSMTHFSVKAVGGQAANFSSMQAFAGGYEQWIQSVNEENYVLIDVPDESLFCIWEYLPAEYAEAKTLLNQYMQEECSDFYDELCAKFGKIYIPESVTYDVATKTATVDLSAMQRTGDLSHLEGLNGASFEDGVLTLNPMINGHEVDRVVIKSTYGYRDGEGTKITDKLSGLGIALRNTWYKDVEIVLDGVGIIAPDGRPALDLAQIEDGANVSLTYVGENYLEGGAGTASMPAGEGIKALSLNVIGTDEDAQLVVAGGSGVDGENAGESGASGGVGLVVGELSVDVAGKLSIIGGNGGNGADGADGEKGYNGANVKIDNTTASVTQPGTGLDGGRGGDGGNGAPALVSSNTIVVSGQVIIIDGSAGNGGNGGRGGDGGNAAGGRYYEVPAGITTGVGFIGWTNGGSGGRGGDGGNGGIVVSTDISMVTGAHEYVVGECGNGGNGGDGGNGTKGGNAGNGSVSTGTVSIANEPQETGGRGGNGGDGGAGGDGKVAGVGGSGGAAGAGGNGSYLVFDRAWPLKTLEYWGSSGASGAAGQSGADGAVLPAQG